MIHELSKLDIPSGTVKNLKQELTNLVTAGYQPKLSFELRPKPKPFIRMAADSQKDQLAKSSSELAAPQLNPPSLANSQSDFQACRSWPRLPLLWNWTPDHSDGSAGTPRSLSDGLQSHSTPRGKNKSSSTMEVSSSKCGHATSPRQAIVTEPDSDEKPPRKDSRQLPTAFAPQAPSAHPGAAPLATEHPDVQALFGAGNGKHLHRGKE